jgi:hypothetical protein
VSQEDAVGRIVVSACAALLLAGFAAGAGTASAEEGARAAFAQTGGGRPPLRVRVRPRIEIRPGPQPYHRDCVSWLQPEYRPSGTVIVPQLRCRWVRG